MNTYQIIKELANQHKISISELERKLNLSNGSISKWAKSKPNSKYIEKVADYFNVSTDYLLGRSPIKEPNSDINPNEYFRMDIDDIEGNQLDQSEIDDLKDRLKFAEKLAIKDILNKRK
ncbi:helix-turn-helix domain-containing protein [Limosilactobacillus reuteri]|uniref:Helix-turn-helix domain protein n=1 Tax=Limosilactobacillus reuteri subsp. rodentium (strain DSM 17509 / CIP 109821 / 100-23) TaxID=349123 RepID=B3XNL7_LIMR1|nr:helix-turn-helix transcriptional regulator [Limosilactobacillus reuteri]EDX42723.1 helix-turn-helix domain protein [Limosilactobacillus reuteri subsp. rodentium]MCC4389397.1 helix-turn-helix transcriptional regulator [Limosilactobacillus reuteri]MCC4391253.1 helix-turn-helix transcriptional regulator [Limosilactobacillus reuteri]MCC4428180.1 helix-turn-helix transcriptional regulator [Limosilactobacillus reuteri]MCC4431991.1 helix-turn-helix transcriptional regulator [Limosilactobacillus re